MNKVRLEGLGSGMNGVEDDYRNDEGELVETPISVTVLDVTDYEDTLAYVEWTLATSSTKKEDHLPI